MSHDYYIYIIAHRDAEERHVGPVKVGISKTPDKRLLSLQTGNPRRLAMFFRFATPEQEIAAYMERAFHEINRDHRLEGEWFDLSPKTALLFMSAYLSEMLRMQIGDDGETFDKLMGLTGVIAARELIATLPDETEAIN